MNEAETGARQSDKERLVRRVRNFIEDEASEQFEDLALDLFGYQYRAMPELERFWASLGAGPESVASWRAIPPVGQSVFKRFELFSGREMVRRFSTSGTSGRGRGSSLFDAEDLELMRRAIVANAKARLFPDGLRTRFLMLVPAEPEAPEMIMAHGMARIAEHFGLGQPVYAVSRGRLLEEEVQDTLRAWTEEGSPITMIGGSFGFVNLMERLDPDTAFSLPPGSRLLDAGGFKGRSREVDRSEFIALVEERFGIPRGDTVNLYGLTELASQFYSRGEDPKRPPHWTRVRVVDPLTLEDVPAGSRGVPLLLDLANVSRPLAVLTDDIAEPTADGGFHLLGRASGSAPRGCSLNLENLR